MANINVKCANCDATLSVSADLVGKLAHCPICDKDFTVTAEVKINVPPAPAPVPGQMPFTPPPVPGVAGGPHAPNPFIPSGNGVPPNGNPLQQNCPGGFIPQNMVKTYLVESILVTLLCCMPLGVVAIVFAAQAGSLLAMQQYQLALKAADTAKKWMIASLITGIVCSVVYTVLSVIAAAMP